MSARRIARSTVVFLVLAGMGCWIAPPGLAQTKTQPVPKLKIGDKAPPLVVEKWLKGDPVPRFEPGRFYVVEFWSTWCRTCIVSMPGLSELQKAYKGKLTVIGVDVWERRYNDETLSKVESFVERQGDRMDYVVAYDGKAGATNAAYMKAAGRRAIPTSFLIDSNGNIAWIGDARLLDMPVEASLAGKWDSVSGAQQVAQVEALLRELHNKLASAPKQALAVWDMLEREYPRMAHKSAGAGYRILMAAQEYPRAYELAKQLVERAIAARDVRMLNELAWMMVDPRIKVEKMNLDLALDAATRADQLSMHRNAVALDTLARVYFLKGDIDRAIDLQTKAIAQAGQRVKAQLQKTLEAYQAARK